MTDDSSFKIKSLSDLLNENNEARDQVLHKKELYPFVMHLLNELPNQNKLYPFVMRVLEENKELILRLAQCEQSHKQIERESKMYLNNFRKKCRECELLTIEVEKLKKENQSLKAKIARAAKRKSR